MIMGVQRVKQQLWLSTIKECKSSGMTVSAFCSSKGISEKSYWYYHKKLGDVLENNLEVSGCNNCILIVAN